MPGHGSGLFRQTHLIASGAQNWISQPLVAQDKQFAYASTLAVYVYNNEDQQLQKVSDDFERFKLETKEHFKKPEKNVAQMAEKEIQALNDKHVNMLKTKPDSVPYCWDYTKNIPAELFLKGW